MKYKIKGLLLIGALLLSGCGSSQGVVEIKSLKHAMVVLNSTKNYTLETENTVSGKISYIYTENSIAITMSKKPSGLQAYIKDQGGIYPLNYEGGYKSGEYILDDGGQRITDLYGGAIVPTMYGIATEYVHSITEAVNTLEIGNKAYKMGILLTLGYSSSDYLDIEKITASYSKGSCYFVITTVSKKNYTYKLTNVNGSRINEVETFLANGGKAKNLENSLSDVRRLIRGNNFTRDIYDFSSESYTGIEVFNPRYFYSRLNSSNTGTGAMAINSKPNEYHSQTLYGCYYFQLEGDPNDMEKSNIGFITTPMYEKPNIVECYHYPTYLKILDNMQFIKEGAYSSTGYTYTGEAFYFDNQTYVYDFVSNFSIDQSFDTKTYVPEAIGIDVKIGATDKDTIINFVYYFTYGTTYAMPIPIRDFGVSNYLVLETVADMYND